jgi:hypothetical protein
MDAVRGDDSPGGEAIHSGLSGSAAGHDRSGVTSMLETIAIILLILWVLGLVSSYTMGGLIHLFLVIAIVVIVIRVIQGRRV